MPKCVHPVIFLRRDLNARLIQILVKHTVEVIVVTEFLKWRFMCNEHQLQIRCGTPILHIVNNCLSDIFKQRKNQELLRKEIPLPVISEILGHKSLETTMQYLRADTEQLRCCTLVEGENYAVTT